MKICIDTTVLIDVLKDEYRSFQEKLYTAIQAKERLLSPSVVFAELMPQFQGDTKQLRLFLKQHKISVVPLDIKAVSLAGERWMRYLKKKTKAVCPNCGARLSKKEHFLSDFYIGGFALTSCDVILTRDRGIYKRYFPDLQNYEPSANKP
jgi:predicted nucleic acid-binding protein